MRASHPLPGRTTVPLVVVTTLFAAACGEAPPPAANAPTTDATGTSDTAATSARFPDVLAVEATRADDGTWTFDVTMSSPYDTPERYADGWRVLGPDGTVYGIHTLAHHHADEQPFTRRQTGVEIPDDTDEVTVEGRDLANGFGGGTVTITLPDE